MPNVGLVFLHAQGGEAIRSSDPASVAGAAFPGTAELVADLLHPPHQQRPGMPITGTSGHQGQQPSPSSLTAQNIPFRVGGN